jgi:hypothetical protein
MVGGRRQCPGGAWWHTLSSRFRGEFATEGRGTSLAVRSLMAQTGSMFRVLLLGIAFGCGNASSQAAGDGGGDVPAETGSPATCSGGGSCAEAASQAASDGAATRAPESSTPGNPSAEAGRPATCDSDGGGSVVTLASGQTAAGPIAVTATDVYWTSQSGTTVSKVPICGGAVTTLALNIQGSATLTLATRALALDATSIYWGALSLQPAEGGVVSGAQVVLKVPLAGGTPVTVASGGGLGGVRVDSTNVYWAAYQGGVMKEALAGGAPAPVATGKGPVDLTIDAANVYWIENTNVVMKAPIAGGSATTLASANDVNEPRAIAVDATSVYWTNHAQNGNGSVMKVPIAGGVAMTLAANQDWPIGIAVDGSNVYWVNSGYSTGSTVMRVPLNGGTPTTLTSSMLPWAIAVDANNVYWTTSDIFNRGTVMKMPK